MKKGLTSLCLAVGTVTAGLGQTSEQHDLGNLGIEDLMKIEVVTASKFAQSLKNVPAAIYVLSGTEIERSGAQSIPDMLRLVPGVNVVQVDANVWEISIRGFNIRYANKLQVLIDGHSIYTPLFSGVNWDEFNIPPGDIDRIEVIRGPGGAIWGANAVNGVINIITKKASETQGARLDLGKGNPLSDVDRFQYGGKAGPNSFYRVYAEYMGFDNLQPTIAASANDGWKALRGGFRLDGTGGASESYMVTGYVSKMDLGQVSAFPAFAPPFISVENSSWTNRHWYLNGSWTKDRGQGKTSEFRASFSQIDRNDPDIQTSRGTLDMEYRTASESKSGAKSSWGASYRDTHDHAEGGPGLFQFDPSSRTDRTYGSFWTFEKPVRKDLILTLGTTLEHNDYTGWEVQPNIRLAWDKSSKETYWASLSRAVRSPSRAESDARFPVRVMDIGQPIPLSIVLVGNKDMKSEKLIAFELGARYQPSNRESFDVTAFVNWYDDLRTFEPIGQVVNPDPVPHIENQYQFENKATGLTGGFEASAQFLPRSDWKLGLNFAFFTDKITFDRDSNDPFGKNIGDRMNTAPRYALGLRSSHDLAHGVTFDLTGQYVGKVPSFRAEAYTRLDARLAWKPKKDFELSLVGQNLLDPKHREGDTVLYEIPSEIRRSIYAMATWKF